MRVYHITLLYHFQPLSISLFSDVTQTTSSTGVAVGIAVMATGTITLTVGVLTGVLLYYCISKHQSQGVKVSSHQQQQAVSSSEEVSAQATSQEKIDQRENLAYGVAPKIELKPNEAYVPVQHWCTIKAYLYTLL